MRTITLEEVKASIQALAEAKPERIYKAPDWARGTCVYNDKGAPSCIVGWWLSSEGLDLPKWGEVNESYGHDSPDPVNMATVDQKVFLDHLDAQNVRLTPAALSFLANVQAAQDNGSPWSSAFERADRWIPEEFPLD